MKKSSNRSFERIISLFSKSPQTVCDGMGLRRKVRNGMILHCLIQIACSSGVAVMLYWLSACLGDLIRWLQPAD